jgi:ABC-2 type transport system ATP-binding protein
MNCIKLTDVQKTIKRRPILTDINLELAPGKIYGFYGRNGSGKTMLFRAISGLIVVDSGEINVFGERIGKDRSFPSDMGITIENVGFWHSFTGMECLRLLARIKNKISEDDIRLALTRVGLDPDDKRKYHQYSLGMKQKLAIAQAIMESPRLIILDEPTNSLDEESVVQIRELLLQEKDQNALILIASHDKEDIGILCDQVFVIQDGRIKR